MLGIRSTEYAVICAATMGMIPPFPTPAMKCRVQNVLKLVATQPTLKFR